MSNPLVDILRKHIPNMTPDEARKLEKWMSALTKGAQQQGGGASNIPGVISTFGNNVGIGTTSPQEKLVIDFGNLVIANHNSIIGAMVQIQSKNNTPADLDVAGVIRGMAKNSVGDDTIFADVYFQAIETQDGNETGAIIFDVQENGADAFPLTLRGHKVGIGTETPEEELHVVGNIKTSGRLIIPDGVAEPATIAGYAQIYVDQADGDLKIKYGDGVVKTIAVDS
jgi:hypothetical protein